MKILLLCLNAFETMEFRPFVDVFGWAHDIAFQLLEMLTSQEKAIEVKKAMGY